MIPKRSILLTIVSTIWIILMLIHWHFSADLLHTIGLLLGLGGYYLSFNEWRYSQKEEQLSEISKHFQSFDAQLLRIENKIINGDKT